MFRSGKELVLCMVITLILVLSMTPLALATSTSAYDSYSFTAWYDGQPTTINYTAALGNTYSTLLFEQYCDNHYLQGTYAKNSLLSWQTMLGDLKYYDNNYLVTTIYDFTPPSSSIYPAGRVPWGGFNNSTTVTINTLYGPDWFDGNTTWAGGGSFGYAWTWPGANSNQLRHTYRLY